MRTEAAVKKIQDFYAKIESDKFNQKKQGVYYTPIHIINYIVENTIGKLCQQKKKELGNNVFEYQKFLNRLKILDPACGSGLFLNQAMDFLLQEHKKLLSFEPKEISDIQKSIIENNLYGVDIDKETIEIAKLALSLQNTNGRDRLPHLKYNLKCGNSLISDPGIASNLAFDWTKEFQTGFDVVFGNPPYIFTWGNGFSQKEKDYFYSNYSVVNYQINTYSLFMEKSYKLLQGEGSYLGLIVPNTWLTIPSMSKLRKFVLENIKNLKIINIVDKVFLNAVVNSCIVLGEKGIANTVEISEMKDRKVYLINKTKNEILLKQGNHIFHTKPGRYKQKELKTILQKINEKSIKVQDIAEVKNGLKTYETGKGKPPQTQEQKQKNTFYSDKKLGPHYIPFLKGRSVCRYLISWEKGYLKYGDHLAAMRKKEIFQKPRVMVRQIPSRPPFCIEAVFSDKYILYEQSISSIINFRDGYSPKFINAVINSRLTSFWFVLTYDKFQANIFPQFRGSEIKNFPIPKLTPNKQIPFIKNTEGLLIGNKKLLKLERLNSEVSEKKTLKRLIQKTEDDIDNRIYKFYGLTPQEIKIVEEFLVC